jgi:hypothetical protein
MMRAARRASTVSARIISRIGPIFSSPKNMLGAAEADALGAEERGDALVGLVGVGAHAEGARFVGPGHQLRVELVDRRRRRGETAVDEDAHDLARLGRDAAAEHFAGGAVDRGRRPRAASRRCRRRAGCGPCSRCAAPRSRRRTPCPSGERRAPRGWSRRRAR